MIRVIAAFQLKAGKLEKAIEIATELVEKTRPEAGCAMYDLLQATNDTSQLVILESWASQDALDKHSASEHFTQLVPQLAELCVDSPVVQSFTQLV